MTTRLLASTASKRKLSTTVLALVSSAVGPSAAFSTMSSSSFAIAQFPCLGDNYGYLLHDPTTGDTCAIDTPCAKTYQNELAKRNWNLTHIFNTHHHSDHQGGNLELKETGGVTIMGPKNEKRPISGIDYAVAGGDTVKFGGFEAQVLDAGGHTHGHVAYYFPKQGVVFTGDCLFTLGCGKMFEGNPDQFWASLERLRNLPDETTVYCAHEYTESNAKFAMSVEPSNPDLVQQVAVIHQKRSRGEPTVPTLLGREKKANPFLRADLSAEIQQSVGIDPQKDTPAVAFGKVRRAKDKF